jgi:hypothetical protein
MCASCFKHLIWLAKFLLKLTYTHRSKRISRGKEMKGEDQKVKNKEAKDKVTRLFKMCNQV